MSPGPQEKCVDISLAVEMLYMATVQDAYDIAVIITGDKDFIPAMRKTRLKGKRVALASMRNSCNRVLTMPEESIRDFNVFWFDDCVSSYIVDKVAKITREEEDLVLVEVLAYLDGVGGMATSRELGKVLQALSIANKNALSLIKAITDL